MSKRSRLLKLTLLFLVGAPCLSVMGCGSDDQVELRDDYPAITEDEIQANQERAESLKDDH